MSLQSISENQPTQTPLPEPADTINLNDYVLPNPEGSAVIIVDAAFEKFSAGDLLIVDFLGIPEVGDFVLFEDSPNQYAIRKYVESMPVSFVTPALLSDYSDDLHNYRGVISYRISKERKTK